MGHMLYDEQYPQEGAILTDYDEEAIRLLAFRWLQRLVPSSVGDNQFEVITQRRSAGEKKAGRFFSTCGELGMCILHALGERGEVLNRDLMMERDGVDREWIPALNMAKLFGTKAQKHTRWVKLAGSNRPKKGDLVCISNGPPRTEHVFFFIEKKREADDDGPERWLVASAGKGGTYNQHAVFEELDFLDGKVRSAGTNRPGRKVLGWIDITKLDFEGRCLDPRFVPGAVALRSLLG